MAEEAAYVQVEAGELRRLIMRFEHLGLREVGSGKREAGTYKD